MTLLQHAAHSATGFHPHGFCYLWQPVLLWLHAITDGLIAAAYLFIGLALVIFVRRARHDLPFHKIFLAFGVFIIACGLTHVISIWTLWTPAYWISGWMKVITAGASVITALAIPPLIPRALVTLRMAREAEEHRAALEAGNRELRELHEELSAANATLRVEVEERRAAEQTARRLAAIVGSLEDAIIGKTLDGVITSWNPGAERLYGYTAHEVIGQHASLLVPADHPDEESTLLANIRRSQPVPVHETERMTKDGRRVTVSLSVSHVKDEDGTTIGAATIARDITAQKEAEEALHESRGRFQSAFHDAPIGMALVGLDGRWLEVNHALTIIVGYTAEELGSRTFQDITHPDDRDRDLDLVRQLLSGEVASYQLEKRYVRRDGALVHIQLTGSVVRSGRGDPLYFVSQIQDVTERKSMEEQLRQAQKVEAVGKLAGGIAHDFNNLLTVIGGNAGFLIQALPDEHPEHESLSEIIHATTRATELTRQLLAFGRRQILQPCDTDLNQIVRTTDRLIRRVIGKDVEVVTVLAEGSVPAHVDPGQIEQVLLNLVLNARDAMPEGGILTIETRVEDVPMEGGDANSTRARRYAALEVRDTGHGMEPQILSQIFEPYFTTKEQGKGTGLGLSMALGTAEQSGGTIQAESAPGRGSCFRLLLPLLEVSLPKVATSAPSTGYRLRQGAISGVVLVVDDQDAIRTLARRFLSRAGLAVLEASNGEAGLRLWESHRDEINLVVTDLEMPLMGGVEMVRRIHLQDADVRIVYMSGHTDERSWLSHTRESNSLFISKPFAMESFMDAVRQLMQLKGSQTA